MRALVTGANGFLGRHVVSALLARGIEVRAMVRPAAHLERLAWPSLVQVFRADLRTSRELERAFEGMDLLIHLAAVVSGDGDAQFAGTVVGTERLLEAMALEVPVVATRVAGVPRLIRAGVNGLLAEPGSLDDLTGALERLLADDGLRRVLQAAGRRTVTAGYCFAARMQKMRTFYDNLLSKNWGVGQRLVNQLILTSPTADATGKLTYNLQNVSGNLLTSPLQTSAAISDIYVMMLSFRYTF